MAQAFIDPKPMAQVLVVGALHHDVIVNAPRLPVLDETLPGSAVTYALGGKGGNQALATARHGANVAFAGRAGNDAAGRSMLAQLAAGGVNVTQVQMDPSLASGMSVAIVTDDGDYGAVIVSAANLGIDGDAINLPDGCKIVIQQNELPERINLAVARKAQARGAMVMLNAAPARPVAAEMLALTGMLVVNRVEAGMLAGSLAGFSGTLIETRGAQGCMVQRPGFKPLHLPAFAVEVISTHGAGDCFVGALAARLALNEQLEAALSYATAAAALHVSTPVEKRPAITEADVMRLMGTRHADGH
jgi:ribokinase